MGLLKDVIRKHYRKKHATLEITEQVPDRILSRVVSYAEDPKRRIEAVRRIKNPDVLKKLLKAPFCRPGAWDFESRLTAEIALRLQDWDLIIRITLRRKMEPEYSFEGFPDWRRGFRFDYEREFAAWLLTIGNAEVIHRIALQHPSMVLRDFLLRGLKTCPFCGEPLTEQSETCTRTVGGPADSFYRESVSYEDTYTEVELVCTLCGMNYNRGSEEKYAPLLKAIHQGPLSKKTKPPASQAAPPQAWDPATVRTACECKNLEKVKALLGPRLQIQPAAVNDCDRAGFSLLHLAVKSGSPELVGYLLQHGADVHAREDGRQYTPLHLAVAELKDHPQQYEIVRQLVAAGSNRDPENERALLTPAGVARKMGCRDEVFELLKTDREKQEQQQKRSAAEKEMNENHQEVQAALGSLKTLDAMAPGEASQKLKTIVTRFYHKRSLDDGYGSSHYAVVDEGQLLEALRALGFQSIPGGLWGSERYEAKYECFPGYSGLHVSEIWIRERGHEDWLAVI